MLPILVAEDDRQLGRALELYLAGLGFEATIFANVEGAKEWAIQRNGEFVFALIDYQLGEECGLDLAKWLLETNPNLSLVLMSGYPPDDLVDLAALGDRAIFLQKPFHPKEVISCFRSLRPLLMMSV